MVPLMMKKFSKLDLAQPASESLRQVGSPAAALLRDALSLRGQSLLLRSWLPLR